jgi:hypothetical protein
MSAFAREAHECAKAARVLLRREESTQDVKQLTFGRDEEGGELLMCWPRVLSLFRFCGVPQ